ncbi:MAG: nuclear transport factor 2 family protein [Thiohalospira sp.]
MNKKEIIYGIFKAISNKDFSDMETFMDDNIVLDFPGVKRAEGKKRVLLLLNAILRKYVKIKFDVHDVILDHNKAVAVWSNKGLTNTNENYENRGLTLVEFYNEKVTLLSDYFKDTSFTKSN